MIMAPLILFIALPAVLIFIGIVALITYLIFRKEKKIRQKLSAEAEKIDKMLAEGKISEKDAAELKRAVGAFSSIDNDRLPEDNHINMIGILHIANGLLIMLAMAVFFLVLTTMFFSVRIAETGNPVPGIFQPAIFIFFILIFAAVPIVEIICAIFLMKRRTWARYLIIAFSILMLFSFPLGTALGIYSIWVLMIRERAGDYFINKENHIDLTEVRFSSYRIIKGVFSVFIIAACFVLLIWYFVSCSYLFH